MISAAAMWRAASAAKRIISTAPIAKFGAYEHVRRPSQALERAGVEAGRPDHDVHAGRDALAGVARAPSRAS